MKKILTFLLTALLAFSVGWAAEVTINMSQQGWTNGQNVTSVTSGDVTITFNKGTSSTAPAYYNTGTGVRLYNGGSYMTVTAGSTNTISNIELTFSAIGYTGQFSGDVGSYSLSGTTGTWTGPASLVTLTNVKTGSGHARLQKVVVTYSAGSSVVAPTITPAGGDFLASQEVTLSHAAGGTIYYTLDGNDPTTSSALYSSPFTLTETTTVKAIAVVDGVSSSVASATFTRTGMANIAEALAIEPGNNSNFTFTGSAVVTASNTGYLWIRDNTGSCVVYNSGYAFDPQVLSHGIVLSPNWQATRIDYNGLKEFRTNYPATFKASGSTQSVEPFERTTISSANMNEYIIVNGLTISGSSTVSNKTQYTTEEGITLYDFFGNNYNLTTGKKYNVTGVVHYNTSNSPSVRLYITNVEEVASSEPRILVDPTTLTINDSGTNNTFTVEGSYLGNDNVGVTQTNASFSPSLSASTGWATNGGSYWYFTPDNGSLNGTVAMYYNGRDLSASETVTLGNNSGASAEVAVNYVADLYIVTDNGVTNDWHFDGAYSEHMTNNNGVYTATFTANTANTFILFARKLGDGVNWGTRYLFGPSSGGDWWLPIGGNGNGTIDVNTSNPIKIQEAGTYTITINANNNTFTIKKQVIGNNDFVLVTSTDDVTANDDYVLVYNETNAMSTTLTSGYFTEVSDGFTVANNVVTLSDENSVNVLRLTSAGDGKFFIQDQNGNYIRVNGNNLATSSSASTTDDYKWSITISNNLAIIQNVSTSRYIAYNTSSPRFNTYSSITSGSAQQYAALYKHGSTEPSITVNPSSLELVIPAGEASKQGTVTVTESNTTGTTSVNIDGDASIFAATLENGTLTVTYTGNATQDHPDGATITLTNGTASATVTVTGYKEPITVTFNPASGQTFTSSTMSGTIECNVSGATIEYSLDGGQTWITATDGAFTTNEVAVGQTVTVQARATYNGVTSEIATATYTRVDASATLYTKVTSADQIQAGLQYILVYEGTPEAINDITTNTGGTGATVAWQTQGLVVDIDNTDVIQFTLEGDATAARFHSGDLYLGRSGTNGLGNNSETVWMILENEATSNDAGGFYLAVVTASDAYRLRYNTGMSGADKFRCYNRNTGAPVYLYVQGAGGVATPTITPGSGNYAESQVVTINCATQDATIYYTVDGGETQTYTEPFTVTLDEDHTSVTIVAWAEKDDETSNQVTVTYNYKSDRVHSIAEFLALDDDEEVYFMNPVTVLFDYSQNSSGGQEYIWVKDRTGYTQFFITPAFDNTDFVPKYENGDVIPAGFKVKKNYYDKGQYYQGMCSNDDLETFVDATEKALADPEQVLLSELLENPADYNNRYLYINKLQVSDVSGLNFSVSADENGDDVSEVAGGSAIVGYNKYNSPAWKNKQGDVVGVALPTDDKYYNVTFIFQKWQNGYEMMPIEFTEWQDNSVRLEDLVATGVEDNQYTISNTLIAARVTWDDSKGKFAIFAKDDEMYANKRYPAEGQEEYLIEFESQDGTFVNAVEQADYDQSNWIEILIPSDITDKTTNPNAYESALEDLKSTYQNKILAGGSISGTYVDALNPTIEVSRVPTVEVNSTYTPNIYCTGNFLAENIDADGAMSYRDDELGGEYFFFMDSKPQEFCKVVWAYFIGNDNYFVAPAQEGYDINGHKFRGSFLADMSLCEDYRVSAQTPVANCFNPSNSYGEEQMLYGFEAIVRKNPAAWNGGSNGAPSRIQPYEDGKESTPLYIVYPLSQGSDSSDNVTAVEEVAASKTVKSVRYYNLMGMESEQPFQGINIVVTRYNDGSISTVKVMR